MNNKKNQKKRYLTAEIKEEGFVFESKHFNCKIAESNLLPNSSFEDPNLDELLNGKSAHIRLRRNTHSDEKEQQHKKKKKRLANQKVKLVLNSKKSRKKKEILNIEKIIQMAYVVYNKLQIFEIKIFLVCFIILLISDPVYKLKVSYSFMMTAGMLENTTKLAKNLKKAKPGSAYLFKNSIICSVLGTALVNIVIFMFNYKIKTSDFEFFKPFSTFKNFIVILYFLVSLMKIIMGGVLVYKDEDNMIFSYVLGILTKIMNFLIMNCIIELLPISWPLLLSFLWLFFALMSGLTFCNFVNLIGQFCGMLFTCKFKIELLYSLIITVHSVTGSIFLFATLYLVTQDNVLEFGNLPKNLIIYAILGKVRKKFLTVFL